jgi:hypothetical protein
MLKKVLEMFVFVSQKIVTSKKTFFIRCGSLSEASRREVIKTVIRYNNVTIHAFIGKKNNLERICGFYLNKHFVPETAFLHVL